MSCTTGPSRAHSLRCSPPPPPQPPARPPSKPSPPPTRHGRRRRHPQAPAATRQQVPMRGRASTFLRRGHRPRRARLRTARRCTCSTTVGQSSRRSSTRRKRCSRIHPLSPVPPLSLTPHIPHRLAPHIPPHISPCRAPRALQDLFDSTKIPDLYDNASYDMIHNQHLRLQTLPALCMQAASARPLNAVGDSSALPLSPPLPHATHWLPPCAASSRLSVHHRRRRAHPRLVRGAARVWHPKPGEGGHRHVHRRRHAHQAARRPHGHHG